MRFAYLFPLTFVAATEAANKDDGHQHFYLRADCENIVGANKTTTDECKQKCKESSGSQLFPQRYPNCEVKLGQDLSRSWVLGHLFDSRSGADKNYYYRFYNAEEVGSADECNTKCHADPDCAYWTYRRNDVVDRGCALKNAKQVDDVLKFKTQPGKIEESGPCANVDCTKRTCVDPKKCIWIDSEVISGPKDCSLDEQLSLHNGQCASKPSPTPQTTKVTTKVDPTTPTTAKTDLTTPTTVKIDPTTPTTAKTDPTTPTTVKTDPTTPTTVKTDPTTSTTTTTTTTASTTTIDNDNIKAESVPPVTGSSAKKIGAGVAGAAGGVAALGAVGMAGAKMLGFGAHSAAQAAQFGGEQAAQNMSNIQRDMAMPNDESAFV